MKALIISLESFQRGEIPEEVKKYILAHHGNIFTILDESSKIKTNEPCKESKKSKRTQAILRLNKIGQRCILTGTFMSKSPVNAYDQMNFLCPDFFPESIYAFAEHYIIRRNLPSVRGARITITEKDYKAIYRRVSKYKNDEAGLMNVYEGVRRYYGISFEDCKRIAEHPEYTAEKNIDELWKRIGDVAFKVDRKSANLPERKVFKTYEVELTSEQKKLYLQLQNQHCTDNITVDNGLKLYLRFQDICNGYEPVETEELTPKGQHKVELLPLKDNPKLELLSELVESIGNEQIVVWCSRTKLLHDAEKLLREKGYTTTIYDGKINKQEREEGYKAFSEGKIQIFLANQSSAGFGLDGLKKVDYAIYLCNSYSVEEREQSIDRIHRGTVEDNKYIIDIVMKNTCEDRVVASLKKGKQLIDSGTTDSEIFRYYGD
jgi:hypothetical protein